MAGPTLAYLIGRIEDLERYVASVPPELLRDDLEALIQELLSYTTSAVDLPNINDRIEALKALDIESLRRGLQILETENLGSPYQLSPAVTLDPIAILRDLRQAINQFADNFTGMGDFGLAFTLDLNLGSRFDQALLCAARAASELSPLVEMVRDKLSLLNPDQLTVIWNRLLRDFDVERGYTMQDPESILPAEFIRFDRPDVLRDKIARYVVQLEPRLILPMMRAGIHEVPSEMLELPRILTWRSAEASEPVSEQEEMVVLSLARLTAILVQHFHKTKADIATILKIPSTSRILSGPDFQTAEGAFAEQAFSAPAVFLEMRKIARIIDALIKYESTLERALRQYKLGLEVMAPEILKAFTQKGELRLQKELCRFLIERNIFAVGTKFGRSETDLLAEEAANAYVLETKLFRRGVGLRPSSIKRSLVQLQSYMDQMPSAPRGVLIIYNLTESLLTAVRKWIQGRYWILPINLQQDPPSSRKRSLAIELGEGNQLIEIIVTEHQPTPPRRTRKRIRRRP
jgi:hypothetical protein